MLRRLDVTIACGERGATAPEGSGYANAEALIADLRTLETGLRDTCCGAPADLLVRPVRREVETFRFSTFRLDIRENSTRTNAALAALARAHPGSAVASAPLPGAGPAWRAWLHAELTRPLRPGHRVPDLGPAETETLGMFRLIREMRDQLDREAIGSFVLSMTHDADDVLGCYLLAKQAGLFADAAAVESCTLPIVPLFESIDGLRRVPRCTLGLLPGRLRITEQGEVVSFKYANRGTAAYQTELLAASVLEHSIKSEREDALVPTAEFDEAMEAVSGAAHAAYRRLIEHPDLVAYFQAASPLEEIALLNIGSRPARRAGARSLADLRGIPWVFAWSQNRHFIPGWYGVGSGLQTFLEVRGTRGEALLRRMFNESRLFRLIVDEVEKTLGYADLGIAREYAGLVAEDRVRDEIFGLIEEELRRTVTTLQRIAGEAVIAERFPQFRQRLARRLPTLNQVNRQQIELLRRYRRAASGRAEEDTLAALLLSINCIAAGFGATG